jgi:sulfonate transport system substrate-binding protein
MRAMQCLLAAAALLWGTGAAAADPLRIRESYVVPVNDWPTILFEKPGLAKHLDKSYSFEPVHFQGTPQMIQALATGELEIANLTFSSFSIAIVNASMSDLRIIADGFQDGVDGYYSNADVVRADSPIKNVEDLKGKVLSTNAAGAAVDIALRAMLRKHGLEDKRDLTIIEAPFPTMPAMLMDGKVDLITAAPPFSFDPKFRQATRVLFTQKQEVGTTQMVLWVVRADFIKKNRAALIDFMEDSLRAERWYLDRANHKEAVAIAARVSKTPEAMWDSWLFLKNGENGDFYRDPNGQPNLPALQANVDLQKEMGFIKSSFDVKQYADLSLVAEATKRLK